MPPRPHTRSSGPPPEENLDLPTPGQSQGRQTRQQSQPPLEPTNNPAPDMAQLFQQFLLFMQNQRATPAATPAAAPPVGSVPPVIPTPTPPATQTETTDPVPTTVPDRARAMKSFMSLRPPTFSGAYNTPLAAENWIDAMESAFLAIDCPETHKVGLATYLLVEDAGSWWRTLRVTRAVEGMTWGVFMGLFREKFFPEAIRDQLAAEFAVLAQGGMTVWEYDNRFTQLARVNPHLLADERQRTLKFIRGLRADLRKLVVVRGPATYAAAVEMAMRLENEEKESDAWNSPKKPRFGQVNPGPLLGSSRRAPQPGRYHGKSQTKYEPRGAKGQRPPQKLCRFCNRSHSGICNYRHDRCFHCNTPGHQAINCPQRQTIGGSLSNPSAAVPKDPRDANSGRVHYYQKTQVQPGQPGSGNQRPKITGKAYALTREEAAQAGATIQDPSTSGVKTGDC